MLTAEDEIKEAIREMGRRQIAAEMSKKDDVAAQFFARKEMARDCLDIVRRHAARKVEISVPNGFRLRTNWLGKLIVQVKVEKDTPYKTGDMGTFKETVWRDLKADDIYPHNRSEDAS